MSSIMGFAMTSQPIKLALNNNVLTIEWSDGRRLDYEVADLRRHCPCATCRTERTRNGGQEEPTEDDGPPLTVDPGVTIRAMAPVGNYAYKILFSDGHDTGIYTLDLLRELGKTS
jgi:DUF971 family protein